MIDRNCDATILSGASDRRLAMAAVDYARSTRERLSIQAADFDLGAMLHHDIPFLASVAGAAMSDQERKGNPHLSGTRSRDRSIADAARHVMRSTAFSSAMPDNGLLADPVKGNVAALLIDRVAALARVDRIDDDGPRDALAAHMASASVRRGGGLVTAWTPGWPDAESDPLADVRAYSRRAYALDDRQLAAELLDHARDARTRLGIADDGSPQADALWQGIPAMAALFGARLEPGEARTFGMGMNGMDDQQSFALASRMVAASLDGGAFLEERDATIGERSLFASVQTGSTLVVLLDRAGRSLDAERGSSDDPTGMAVMSARTQQGLRPDALWQPDDQVRLRQEMMLAARTFPGLGS